MSIGYEWGSQNHLKPNDKCPDHNAHAQVAKAMAIYGGSFAGEDNYKANPINSIVYPVWGGMEDWMYASAWDKTQVKKCSSSVMSASAHESEGRATVFLIETSQLKKPALKSLGRIKEPLENSPSGHIARNARVGLVGVDTVQPYVCLSKRVAIKKSSPRLRGKDKRGKRKDHEHDRRLDSGGAGPTEIKVKWYVGGGMSVDSTHLSLHPPLLSWSDLYQHRAAATPYWFSFDASLGVNISSIDQGRGRWGFTDPLDPKSFSAIFRVRPLLVNDSTGALSERVETEWEDQQPVYHLTPGDHWLVAWAAVDQEWGSSDQGEPKGPPMSHVANARTNVEWKESVAEHKRSGGRQVRGRVEWPSDPALLRVDAKGQISVVSQVEDCAWWTREYHPREDIYPVAHPIADKVSLVGAVGALIATTTSADESDEHHFKLHQLHDAVDWIEWLSQTAFSRTGLLVFICWLSIFGFYIFRCQRKRAYVGLKKRDITISAGSGGV